MDVSEIHALHRQEWDEALDKFGGPNRKHFLVPADVQFRIGERLRCRYVINRYPDDPSEIFRHAIAVSVCQDIIGDIERAPRPKKDDKQRAAMNWAKEHVGEQITANDLAEAVDWSYGSAIAFIKDNIGTFASVKRGTYEVRDAEAERAAAKA